MSSVASNVLFICLVISQLNCTTDLEETDSHTDYIGISPVQYFNSSQPKNLTDALHMGAKYIDLCYGYLDVQNTTQSQALFAEQYAQGVKKSIYTWTSKIVNPSQFEVTIKPQSECESNVPVYQNYRFRLNVYFYESERKFFADVFPKYQYRPTLAAAKLPNNLWFARSAMLQRGKDKMGTIIAHETGHVLGLPHSEKPGSILRANTDHSLGINQPSPADFKLLENFSIQSNARIAANNRGGNRILSQEQKNIVGFNPSVSNELPEHSQENNKSNEISIRQPITL